MVSSLFQIFIGFSGLIGFLLRFIGPLTVAPTIALVGLSLFGVCSDYAGKPFTSTPINLTIYKYTLINKYIYIYLVKKDKKTVLKKFGYSMIALSVKLE